jgi:2,3-dihydro-2,3-dihydroxybenzoate dehydrogenase
MKCSKMAGKVALVTGAAGGIGAQIARQLGAQGAAVGLLDQSAEGLRRVAKDLANDNVVVEAFPVDVRSSAEVEAVVKAAEDLLGPIDYLVNAAGVLRVGEAAALSDEDWALTFDVNTTGVFFTSRAVVNRMMTRRRGAVVTVASNTAGTARTEMAAYAASKAATTTFAKCLGLEVARYGIRCNVVSPGTTDTAMLSALRPGGDGSGGDDGGGGWALAAVGGMPEAYRVGIPLGKVAQPAEIADAVLFLLSDRASHITMHQLTVDGGATLGH